MIDGLYLGGKELSLDKATMKEKGVTHILNVTVECRNHFPDEFTYLQLPIEDSKETSLDKVLPKGIAFIQSAAGSTILVHCTVGMSRSAAMVLAYLMVVKKMRLKEGMQLLKSHRPITSPNIGFLAQLIDMEKSIFGEASLDIERYERFGEVDSFAM